MLDTNIFIALSRANYSLPQCVNYIVPDIIARETFTSSNSNRGPASTSRKILDILVSNCDRVFVAKYWQDISRDETHPGYGTEPEGCIHWDSTRQFRNGDPLGAAELDQLRQNDFKQELARHSSAQDRFLNYVKETANLYQNFWEAKPEHSLRGGPNAQRAQRVIDWIRRPDLIDRYLENHPNDRYNDEPWRSALNVYPDVHAMGRWLRLIESTAVLHAVKNSTPAQNDFEDAQIAFTASYFDGLVSGDRRLQQLAGYVFPSIRVSDSVPECWTWS